MAPAASQDAGCAVTEELAQVRRLRIWTALTPDQRDYDRFVAGVIPQGASWVAETAWGREHGRTRLYSMTDYACGGCSCHINPPCYHCEQNHRDHDTDGHVPDGWELEVAEAEACEEAAYRAAREVIR